MTEPSQPQRLALQQAARQALANSYSPYSNFAVGAALLTDDGAIVTGCNVENASYGLTLCAERVAVAKAVSEGHLRFVALALFTATPEPVPPCGACLQTLAEFAPDLHILSFCDSEARLEGVLEDFLGHPFSGRTRRV